MVSPMTGPGLLFVRVNLKAGDGARTRDLELGKLTLYQLSYAREIRDKDICT
jgi:hypothetical protein